MLGIDERGHSARFLGFGNYLQGDRRFAGRFRSKHFDYAAAGKATYAEGGVE